MGSYLHSYAYIRSTMWKIHAKFAHIYRDLAHFVIWRHTMNHLHATHAILNTDENRYLKICSEPTLRWCDMAAHMHVLRQAGTKLTSTPRSLHIWRICPGLQGWNRIDFPFAGLAISTFVLAPDALPARTIGLLLLARRYHEIKSDAFHALPSTSYSHHVTHGFFLRTRFMKEGALMWISTCINWTRGTHEQGTGKVCAKQNKSRNYNCSRLE